MHLTPEQLQEQIDRALAARAKIAEELWPADGEIFDPERIGGVPDVVGPTSVSHIAWRAQLKAEYDNLGQEIRELEEELDLIEETDVFIRESRGVV